MAIEYARVSIIGRAQSKNACERAAYNGNCKIKDLRTNCTFNLLYLKSNVYHEVFLPAYVNIKFKDVEVLMNEVERCEKRKDSQLLREYLLALPSEVEITLDHKIKLIKLFIEKLKLIQAGLGIVIDIHKPDVDDTNWYAKLLVTTRRFDKSGDFLGEKARDMDLPIKKGKFGIFSVPDIAFLPGSVWRTVQNEYFQNLGFKFSVKPISDLPQEHIGRKKYGVIAEQKRLYKKGL